MNKQHKALALIAALALSGAANAALVDRGGGLIYDTDLNVTWLQDANYSKTSSYDADGLMNWNEAMTWAANLSYYDSVRNVTYTDWRLPNVSPINGGAFNYSATYSYNGSTDNGYNISAQGTAYAGGTGSEMAHLFYNSLNNKSPCDPATSTASSCAGPQAGWGLANTSPFNNLQADKYWSGNEYAPDTYNAWVFYFDSGVQNYYNAKNNSLYALAIRPGDVSAVPVPAAFWLFGSGLLGLVGMARRKKA